MTSGGAPAVPSVDDDEILWRRLFPGWVVEEDGQLRVMSIAFIDRRSGEVSTHRKRFGDLGKILKRHPETPYAAELLASVPRANEHDVIEVPEEDDPSHAIIKGRAKGTTKGQAKAMAKASRLIGGPPPGGAGDTGGSEPSTE